MNRIDFVGVITVNHANPNGDPMTGNLPRVDYDNIGEISQVCLKRKIRNRLQDMGENILIQSNDRRSDEFPSIEARLTAAINNTEGIDNKGIKGNKIELANFVKSHWVDARAFGATIAYKNKKDGSVSCPIRGCVSVNAAFSVDPVEIESIQIAKSTNGSGNSEERGSDSLGMMHRVRFGVYKFFGSFSVTGAKRNGLSEEDAKNIIKAMATMFINDESVARPIGTMDMAHLFVIKHESELGKVSLVKIDRAIKIHKKAGVTTPDSLDDYDIDLSDFNRISGIVVEDILREA